MGLVGYGLAGERFHAPLIRATPGLRIHAVVTTDAERAARARGHDPDVRILDRPDPLWAGGTVDLAVIASPNRTHVPLAADAIRAGVAVVVDKPLAGTAAEARRLVRAAADAGVLLTVFHNRRWDGDFLTLQYILADGVLGDVHRFESRFERWRPTPKSGWRESGDPADAGGLLYDLGSHLIDQALVLFGPARLVYAEIDRRRPDVQVDDDVFVAITHRSGTRSHLWMSALAPMTGPRMRALGSRAGYTKHGLDVQEAVLRSDTPATWPAAGEEEPTAWGRIGTGERERPIPTLTGDYPRFYRFLARALREHTPPPVDPADAVASLEVIEAAQRSAAERRVVELG